MLSRLLRFLGHCTNPPASHLSVLQSPCEEEFRLSKPARSKRWELAERVKRYRHCLSTH
jgi:hypothetical protein